MARPTNRPAAIARMAPSGTERTTPRGKPCQPRLKATPASTPMIAAIVDRCDGLAVAADGVSTLVEVARHPDQQLGGSGGERRTRRSHAHWTPLREKSYLATTRQIVAMTHAAESQSAKGLMGRGIRPLLRADAHSQSSVLGVRPADPIVAAPPATCWRFLYDSLYDLYAGTRDLAYRELPGHRDRVPRAGGRASMEAAPGAQPPSPRPQRAMLAEPLASAPPDPCGPRRDRPGSGGRLWWSLAVVLALILAVSSYFVVVAVRALDRLRA